MVFQKMKVKKMFPLVAVGLLALAGCNNKPQEVPVTNPAINLANLDSTVTAGEDFYQYACGGWMKGNPLTPDCCCCCGGGRWRRRKRRSWRQPSVPAPENIAIGSDGRVVKIPAYVDPRALEEELEAIRNLGTKSELSKMIARLQKEGMSPFFALYVSADEKNSSMNIVQLYQAGLGMGDRDYYLQEDETFSAIREAYKNYINRLFLLAGSSPEQADAAMNGVMKVESCIARVSLSREELRDSQKNYNKMAYADFIQSNDAFDWAVYFEAMGLNTIEELDAKQLVYYQELAKALKDISIDDQKYYLAFNLLDAAAPYLSDDFALANFDFYGKVMSGKQEMEPRWKRALSTVNRSLGEAVGQMYVAKYFPASSKEKMLTLVGNLQKALSERINNLAWMGDSTKMKAQEKLAAFTVKIGYPDTWRDYSALEIRQDSYWANVRRSAIFEMEYMLADAGKPVDKARWFMTPQTVNAYYNPTTNEICFPAGILQPPFFNPEADDAVNYGAIGVVIGHEMTHGFDDQGRNYDKEGNLTDWWTPEDAARFTERADKLAEQYNNIIVIDTVHANGRFTLGENIADQGGLLVAHQAYRNSLQGQTPEPIDGLTDEQRFYLGYATLWAQNIRPEEIIRRTKMDPHSLGKWRVNAALKNIDTFYQAFGIQEGDAMYMNPSERVNVW